MCLADSCKRRFLLPQGKREYQHLGYKRRVALTVLFLALLPAAVFAHMIAEISKAPDSFDQQTVSVVGEVANLVTRYGDSPYTTFDLLDANDTALPVFVLGKPAFEQGDSCHVTGTFVQEKTIGTYVLTRGVAAEKVEKVSAAEYKTTGQLFRKKKGSGKKSANKYPRGFDVPQ